MLLRDNPIHEVIKHAILHKQHILATYQTYYREMCPHAIGLKNGKVHCLFYQFGGESSSGIFTPSSTNNWRCIPIAGLSNIEVRNGVWYTAQNHSKRQICIDLVEAEVGE